jgi:hypothetical protein
MAWSGIFAREHRRVVVIGLCAARLMIALLALMIVGKASAGERGSSDERRACVPDVLKHCGEFIPDPDRIAACLRRNLLDLSPECRIVMAGERKI